MDEEIRQLLHSLEAVEADAAQAVPKSHQPIPIPATGCCKQSLRKRNWRIGVSSLIFFVGCLAATYLYMAKSFENGSKRIVEASRSEGLILNRLERIHHIPVFCSNDLSPALERESTSQISAQYDLIPLTSERIKNLRDISKNIHDVTTTIITSPDIACHQVLRRLVARFEQADVFHMNEVALQAQERRSLLKEQKEREAFEAAMSCMGLGNMGTYQKRSDEISVASVLIDNCIAAIKTSKDVVSTAKIVRAATRLFNEMKSDTLANALIDLDKREKDMFDAARVSVEKMIASLLDTKRLDDITKEERESIAYLYAVIPSMDPKIATALYAPPPSKSVRRIFCAENNMGSSDSFFFSKTVYLASEGPCSTGIKKDS